jgi:hypothetical protein
MRIKRSLPIVAAVLVVAAALTLAVQLRKHAPPEPARLLPGADAFIFLNLDSVRAFDATCKLPPVTHDPEYQRFIEQTGFEFERDLNEAAFAIHYPASWPNGGTGGAAPEPRFSEVLKGKFDERLVAYLRRWAQSVENYNSVDIYTILLQGRSFRVAVLSADFVAASNHDDPSVIHGIVDRSRRLASPFGGPALLRQYYKHVQLASMAWAVARIEPLPGGFSGALLTKPAIMVVSGSYLNPLHLRPEHLHLSAAAFAANSDDARNIADRVNVFLALSHTAENSVGPHDTDPDVKAFFNSVEVKQQEDRAMLSAQVPPGFVCKMLTGSSPELTPPSASPAPPPAQSPAHSPSKSQ